MSLKYNAAGTHTSSLSDYPHHYRNQPDRVHQQKWFSRSGGALARGWLVEVLFFLRISGKYLLASPLRPRGCVRITLIGGDISLSFQLVSTSSRHCLFPFEFSVNSPSHLQITFLQRTDCVHGLHNTRIHVSSNSFPISAALLHFVTQNVVVRRAASHGFFFPRSSIKF